MSDEVLRRMAAIESRESVRVVICRAGERCPPGEQYPEGTPFKLGDIVTVSGVLAKGLLQRGHDLDASEPPP